ERLLGSVVGEAGATDRGGGAPSIPLVSAHELGVGIHVSLLRSIDQLRIVRGPPLGSAFRQKPHRRTYTGSRPEVPAASSEAGSSARTASMVSASLADLSGR